MISPSGDETPLLLFSSMMGLIRVQSQLFPRVAINSYTK